MGEMYEQIIHDERYNLQMKNIQIHLRLVK